MKVVVLGASGFIGNPVAQAFSRAGHIVYGTTRSSSTAASLDKEEIISVVLDPTTAEGKEQLAKLAEKVDVVIDTIPETGPEGPLATFKAVSSAVEKRQNGAKLTYIYTGGSWCHSRGLGGLDQWTDERQPYGHGVQLTQWRWKVEEQVLASTAVQGIVIRPSILYGRSGSLTSMFVFQPAAKAQGGTFKVVGEHESRMTTIHADDLADLYLRVAERGSICKGQAFLGANPQTERLTDFCDAVVRASGSQGYELQAPSNPFEDAWVSTTLARPSLGEALTGWRPKKMGLVDGVDLYWAAAKAHMQEQQ
ncbi:uncharacterized protein MKK02DRAFT_37108 [Dioszegia hungarica]|uniref:Saccharopine dehydrogenase NADP binding domain-containing protein n=1 Tax=Dioszegia hungarica TaxID=4972 RepID=A0AA38LUW5_9TREE|nr:uncharacterized protein MKK02DRAFT_37108 [Dioszegia hungarica]KAI9636345.1 hypothetical protein MKK02DRAFT_37108 [Dioszegia hungarica]